EWMAEAKAVARLIRLMDSHDPSDKDWMDYLDSVAPVLVVDGDDGMASEIAVNWAAVRTEEINQLGAPAARDWCLRTGLTRPSE
ncbi:hypothetical protein BCR44DRAFT_39267, partial [Catenaria anguillulae PL171]